VVEEVQPQDIRCLHDLPQCNEVCRNGLDILSARLFCKRPYLADRIVLEAGDLGRHEAEDPSLPSHDVGEKTGPVATARVDVDDRGARIDSREPDQLG
jgi:hypothetical protein